MQPNGRTQHIFSTNKYILIILSIFVISNSLFAVPENHKATKRTDIKQYSPPHFKLPPVDGEYTSWDCTDDTENAACIAAGYSEGTSEDYRLPILIKSLDGGVTWIKQEIPKLVTYGQFDRVSCTHGNNSICIAAGYVPESENNLMVAQSNDGLNSWSVQYFKEFIVSGLPTHFHTSCCTGSGKNAYCLVAGGVNCWVAIHAPFYQTRNQGNTWEKVSTIENDHNPFFGDISESICETNYRTIQAAVVLRLVWPKTGECPPINYKTENGGKTWTRN